MLIVPVGSNVNFPNKDNVRHHVYSFSPTKKFELKLYGRDESRSVLFDKAGVVALGCNIHDQMIAYVVVVDTAYAAKTGADGFALIRNAPAGNAVMTVWQPYVKTAKNQVVKTIAIPPPAAARTSASTCARAWRDEHDPLNSAHPGEGRDPDSFRAARDRPTRTFGFS
uniref:Methylamine utilization protein n=1 Tax=Phenylobacterium glaciei TaxID=2803784 RepID=A0A974P451_9CAUL|nr:hypothetical protein JKL49_25860 [Phenylobacterium glaciei]